MTDQKDQNNKPKKTDNISQKVIDSFLNKDNNYVRIFLNITIFLSMIQRKHLIDLLRY